ncbi:MULTISPECIES: glycosyltransferase family 4 protein [Chryseobacterium]|uniref:Glycosyltransferase involved in cell wall biosynthesis n=1 Tax=Chryseobacterium camelliae TaxID=1265445 RepID=A0ABU0TGJ3_9FLAO|nr:MULTISPECIES: glycosyltransferase family 1 protein [Chryseobacterium]MDT3406021.1 glycosyltransferase involved in cell wall biosynthesis [Pseudacidovorax intermedius]MDQ1096178.1 glycosyltransferase involved in cell wall biosynthesis [Chryseobacterium camelliae]MDQ1100115.1 glycosyltransferase involved in cell wall biosynthesis [Chryseobacterium sp. SORGH_AS_1048]MDR6087458.1 glycosyltransferase involved in cell wall biosynthesis [Chryseobacterium sp. SORGH_AS_0909]MDR6131832.1 glycosyltran
MKIAYDAKRFFHNTSGLGNYSRDLVRILAEYFPENEYLLLNKNKSQRGQDILDRPDVRFVETSKGSLSRQLKMGKDAQDQHADIFHGLSGELPLKWTSRPIKKVVTIHDLIFLRYPQYYSFFDRKIHLWKFKKAANAADRIIAISEKTKQDIIHFLKVPEHKIEVVYQGCHQAFKEQQPEDFIQSVKKKYSLPERFILNVGTIEERKNLLSIVKSIRNTAIPLVVVGRKTKYAGKAEAFIRKNKMEQQVLFLEGVSMDELAALYKLADIFVYPSFFEGFGIPVIESLFSKTVVITSNTSCLPEAGGPDSVYIDPGNELDLKAKITFLWNSESERKRRAEKGFEFVQKFNDRPIAHQLMNLYQKLL